MNAILFTTTHCPNCPAFKKELESIDTDIKIEYLDEHDENFITEAGTYQVQNAPTLLLLDKNDEEIGRTSDQKEIKNLLT